MLDEKQIIDFCNATSQYNSHEFGDETSWICEPDEVALTRDTLENFKDGLAHGEPDEILETPVGELFIWFNRQSAKGCQRGDLFVMDFGDARAAYFTGEVPE